VVDGEPRFRMLETIREYALEQLQTTGEEAEARRRHLAWVLDLTETGQDGMLGPDGGPWIDRLVVELDNIRAALTLSVIDHAPGSARAGVRTAGALFLFWFTRDYLVECQRWLEQTLAADHEQGQAGSGP